MVKYLKITAVTAFLLLFLAAGCGGNSGHVSQSFILTPGLLEDNKESDDYRECTENLRKIATALNNYKRAEMVYPRSLKDLVPDYLDEIPRCPSAGADVYTKSYECSYNREYFTIYCSGHWHKDVNAQYNYPLLNSHQGLFEGIKK